MRMDVYFLILCIEFGPAQSVGLVASSPLRFPRDLAFIYGQKVSRHCAVFYNLHPPNSSLLQNVSPFELKCTSQRRRLLWQWWLSVK